MRYRHAKMLDVREVKRRAASRGLNLGQVAHKMGISRQLLHYHLCRRSDYMAGPLSRVLRCEPQDLLVSRPASHIKGVSLGRRRKRASLGDRG